ncbi:serine/threonine-protein phosphatase 6 regulatory ankyrin repeat subunit B-like [Polistes fuscatus]|uniref:serine/threonine-protein phosphatase 6 regulatory ankyrin repeat subunit B-like n=1 Tax=Polistes fuscatus TaxID=30207 RepID=UPI001CA98599|nr:serine/threonine-protein phosphatase 6 regulatory ankyrin repeat subunit B-like [Polistes fuscatus]
MDDNLSNNLCNAIEKRDLKKVIDLISEGANVNACGYTGMFPLQIAIKRESKEIIEELLHKGADVNIEVHDKKLVEYAMEQSNIDIVKLLVEKGATIKFHNNNEENILRYLIKNGMLELLQCIIEEININFQTKDGHTLLIMAAEEGQLEIVKFLCNMGININARSSRNSTALHFAIGNSSAPKFEIVQFLIDNGAEIDVENSFGYTPLQNALYNNNFKVAKLLIEKGADVNRIYMNTHYARQRLGGTLLHWASRNYNSDQATKFLIKNGANINATENDGRTPLCLLVKHCGTPEMVKFFVENGAYLKNTGGGSPLYWAIYSRNIQLQTLLIELGTDVDGNIDSHENFKAPLHLAYDLSVVKLLIDKGANVNIKDKYGCTPLHCVSKISLAKYLVENGADIHAKNNDGETPLHRALHYLIVEYLIEKGADVNIPNKNGYTPLHFARNLIIARHLIEHGANIRAVTKDGKSVLHGIIEEHSYFNISFDEMSDLINFLIKKGIDVNATDQNGNTLLHLSAEKNNEYAAIVLLANCASISSTNIENKKPADFGYMLSILIANIEKIFDTVKKKESWKTIESLLLHRMRCFHITLNDFKTTILHSMVIENNTKMVENLFTMLRRKTMNCITKYNLVNARDKNQWMPLHYAVKRGNETIVKYLLDNGAIYNADVSNKPILLTDNFKIKNILELTEKLFEYIKLGNETKVAECIQTQKEIINARQNNGNTPLHVAIYYDHFNIAKLLLDNKADFSLINDTRDTVLHFATVKGYEVIVETLLEKANRLHDIVNVETVNGMTALHLAAKHNSMKLVKLFLSYGAIYNAKNEDGQMPIDLSTDKDIIDFFKFIHELFEDAKYGRTEIINKLKNLSNNDSHAIRNLHNRQMYTLMDILKFNEYDNIVAEFLKLNLVKLEIKKGLFKTVEKNEYFSDSDEEDLGFGLFD